MITLVFKYFTTLKQTVWHKESCIKHTSYKYSRNMMKIDIYFTLVTKNNLKKTI